MPNWIRVGSASEVPDGGCRLFEVGGHAIAVFRAEGGMHAIDNTCLHRGGPLNEGSIQGTIVTCPWHFWTYDVTTGKSTMAGEVAVRKYPLEVRGEDLFVDVG